jgi:hypothetical protein
MRTLLASLLLLACASGAQAQAVPGYYIATSGDTVRGQFPGYHRTDQTPERIAFRPNDASAELLLTPQNTRRAVVDGADTYIAYTGTRLTNPVSLYAQATASSSPVESSAPVSAFLRVVSERGPFAFLVLNDGIRSNFYYTEAGGAPQELRNLVYASAGSPVETRTFSQQLINLLNAGRNDNKFGQVLQRMDYSENAFAALAGPKDASPVAPTTAATTGTISTSAPAPASSHNRGTFIALAGVAISQLTATYDPAETLSEFGSSVGPTIGIAYQLSADRPNDRFYIRPQIMVQGQKFTRKEMTNGFVATRTYKSTAADFQFGFGYRFVDNGNVRLSVGPHVGASVLINRTMTLAWINPAGKEVQVQEKDTEVGMSFGAQLAAELGRRFHLWTGYTMMTKGREHVQYEGRVSLLRVGIGVGF